MRSIAERLSTIACATSMLTACISTQPPVDSQKPLSENKRVKSKKLVAFPLPSSLPSNPTLYDAAYFAWYEFLALNLPAQQNADGTYQRDMPEPGGSDVFGKGASSLDPNKAPLVWETFRHKVEIYPGYGTPHGATLTGTKGSYQVQGYNDPPQYIYGKDPIPACKDPGDPKLVGITPWINLDENSQIGLDKMYAGVGVQGGNKPADGQFLFLAKANKVQFDYVLNPDNSGGTKITDAFWNHGSPDPNTNLTDNPYYDLARYNFNEFVYNKIAGNPASLAGKTRVNFPAGMIEVKSAWRRLTDAEKTGKRFHVAPVRYYVDAPGSPSSKCYKQEIWGLAALHIIQKTPGQPYFVFATFEQADNLQVLVGGKPTRVEGTSGNQIIKDPGPALDTGLTPPLPTNVSITPAQPGPSTLKTIEQYNTSANGNKVNCQPGPRLSYQNIPPQPQQGVTMPIAPQGTVCVSQRSHSIPQEIIYINETFQFLINQWGIADSPWPYYKLINVQFKPLDKRAGTTEYSRDNTVNSQYYLSNSVVETNFNLQFFSGRLVAEPPGGDVLISDYNPPNIGGWTTPQTITAGGISTTTKLLTLTEDLQKQPFKNLYSINQPDGSDAKAYNMGGCMGCHGNAQIAGDDFSFILNGGRNDALPDSADPNAESISNTRYRRVSR